jgi:hypothetical protein
LANLKTWSEELSYQGCDENLGRDLRSVLGVSTVVEAIDALHARNNGTGKPNWKGLRLGDYLDLTDGLSFKDPTNGNAQVTVNWNASYQNLRVVIAGFNTYLHLGNVENTLNHLLFVFKNSFYQRTMNDSNTNAGGYPASKLRQFLNSGAVNGMITTFKGRDYLMPTRRLISNKDSYVWVDDKLYLPTEIEVFGVQVFGDELKTYCSPIQIPLYAKSYVYRQKKINGGREHWWLASPTREGLSDTRSSDSVTSGASWGTNMTHACWNGLNCLGVAPCFNLA